MCMNGKLRFPEILLPHPSFPPICRVHSKRRLQIEKCPWCCDSVVVILWLAWDGYHKMISLVFISNLFIQQCNEKNPNEYISKEKNLWKFLNSIIMLCPYCHQISPDMKTVFLWKTWKLGVKKNDVWLTENKIIAGDRHICTAVLVLVNFRMMKEKCSIYFHASRLSSWN